MGRIADMRLFAIWIAGIGGLLLSSSAVHGRSGLPPARTQEAQVAACIQRSAFGRPWLARTLWGLRDQEGGWIGAAIGNANGSEDLGPLQVNSWWVVRIARLMKRRPGEIRRWLQYDACFNVDAARWIFLSSLVVTKDYWRAIGVYHSPNARRQQWYAHGVARRLSRRFGAEVFGRVSRRRLEGDALAR